MCLRLPPCETRPVIHDHQVGPERDAEQAVEEAAPVLDDDEIAICEF